MRKIVLSSLLVLIPLCVASWSVGQDVDDTVCKETIQISCTQCHSTMEICHKLGESDADWPEIVKEMGERGKLSQDIQDTVVNCLTKTSEPTTFVCTK